MKKNLLLKFCLLVFLIAPSSLRSQVLFSENFSSGSLPAGWTNDSLGLAGTHLWEFNNPFLRMISGAGFDANFAIYDADQGGVNDGFDENSSLTTPSINISSASNSLYLEFDEQFRAITFGNGASRIIQYSIDGGANWVMLDSTTTDVGYPNPAVHTVFDISSVISAPTLMVRFQYIGSWDWWWAIDNVEVISRQNCVAPPNAGTAVSSMVSVCSLDTFNLSLSGADVGFGLSYQWQSSPDSINWTDMTNDTTETVLITQSTSTYYRCVVTCSGQNANSIHVYVSMNAPTTCYCIGIFDTGCDAIDKVQFNTLSNSASDCNTNVNNYINYPDTGLATTTVLTNVSYDLTFASGLGSGNHGAGVWFDFNHDGDFQDAGEFFHISDSIPESSGDFITPILIPNGASGSTRMRIRYVYDNPVTQTSDCEPYGFGETEDYTILINTGPIGLRELTEKNVSVYPIPTSDEFRVSISGFSGPVNYLLFDQTGRMIFMKNSNRSEERFSVSSLSRGIYLLRIETSLGNVTRKVVVR